MSSHQEPHQDSVNFARTCPFCYQEGFKKLGNHLYQCKERMGRDYSGYLSAKTLTKRAAVSHKFCPKCHKQFKRLDTHLRLSATCKDLSSVSPSPVVAEPDYAQSNAAVSANSAILTFTPHDYQHKAAIKLPSTQEEWEDANSYFSHVVVPQVVAEVSPEAKNNRLSEAIYSFFASKYGTKQQKRRERRRTKHGHTLNKAKKLKNEARKELRQARSNPTISAEHIMSLARKFLQSVRTHSRCRRAYARVMDRRKSRCARHECHQNFWPFAKRLLEETPGPNVEPEFSEVEATQFFTSTYHAEPRDFVPPDWIPRPPAPTTEFHCDELSYPILSMVLVV